MYDYDKEVSEPKRIKDCILGLKTHQRDITQKIEHDLNVDKLSATSSRSKSKESLRVPRKNVR